MDLQCWFRSLIYRHKLAYECSKFSKKHGLTLFFSTCKAIMVILGSLGISYIKIHTKILSGLILEFKNYFTNMGIMLFLAASVILTPQGPLSNEYCAILCFT